MSDKITKASDYIPLNERLKTLQSRLDIPEYNEQQQVLFPQACEGLTHDVFKKVCRFITDCEIPSTEVCLVATNYKETMPPSHPREALPINLLAELQTCCEPGRIACPELIMYSIEPENEVEEMMLYGKERIGLGDLKIGIDFKNRVHCCESLESWEDSLEDFDFIEVLPSLQLDFSCEFGSLEYSGEYLESVELCYKRLEFLRKYHIWMDICKQEISFEANVEPVAELCLACDTEYTTSIETSVENSCGNLTVKVKKNVTIDWCAPEFKEELSIELSQECGDPVSYESVTEAEAYCLHGAYLKYKLKEKMTVDWCSGEIELEPELVAECKCQPISSPASSFPVNITIPGCSQGAGYEMKVNGTGTIQNTLQPNGQVTSAVNLGNLTASGRLGGSGYITFVEQITQTSTGLEITSRSIQFTDGLLCNIEPPTVTTIDIDCMSGDLTNRIDCYRLRKRCGYCDCSDSSSSSSTSDCKCRGTFEFTVPNSEVKSKYEFSAPAVIRFSDKTWSPKSTAVLTYKNSSYSTYSVTVCGTKEQLQSAVYAGMAGIEHVINEPTLMNITCEDPSNSHSISSSYSSSQSSSISSSVSSSVSSSRPTPCTGEFTGTLSNALYNDLPQPVLVTYTINGEQYVTSATATPATSSTVLLTFTVVGTEEEIRGVTSVTVTPTTDNQPRSVEVVLDESSINCGEEDSSDSASSPVPQCTMEYEFKVGIDFFNTDDYGMAEIDMHRRVYWDLDPSWGPVEAALQNPDGPHDNDEYIYRFKLSGTEEWLNNRRMCKVGKWSDTFNIYTWEVVDITPVEGSLKCNG